MRIDQQNGWVAIASACIGGTGEDPSVLEDLDPYNREGALCVYHHIDEDKSLWVVRGHTAKYKFWTNGSKDAQRLRADDDNIIQEALELAEWDGENMGGGVEPIVVKVKHFGLTDVKFLPGG